MKKSPREYQKEYRKSLRGKAAIGKYNNSEKGRAARKKYISTEKGRATKRDCNKKNDSTDFGNMQMRARRAVRHLVMTELCEVCGLRPPANKHHESYKEEHNRTIICACGICHGGRHRFINFMKEHFPEGSNMDDESKKRLTDLLEEEFPTYPRQKWIDLIKKNYPEDYYPDDEHPHPIKYQ